MPASYVDSTIANNNTATSIEITKPATVLDGDVFFAFLGNNDDNAWTTLTGWTALGELQDAGGNDRTLNIQRKVITDAAGEPATYTFSRAGLNTDNFGVIVAVRGIDNTTPEDATSVLSSGANDNTPDSPSITTVTDGAFILLACGLAGTGAALTFVAPTGADLREGNDLETSFRMGVSTFIQASAGATGAQNWPNTGGSSPVSWEWVTGTVAARPVVAGGAAAAAIRSKGLRTLSLTGAGI